MKKIKSKKVIPPILKEIKNYKPVKMDYSSQKSISYSQISTFLTCPKKWSLMYREGHYKSEQNMNMTFGTAIHTTIQNFLSTFYNESGVKAEQLDLEEYFEQELIKTYQENTKQNNNIHFSNPEELGEFYDDGVMILEFLKKKKGSYFSKRGWHLVGVEVPILISPYERFTNVIFKGFIDLILYNENTNTFTIYDIKTSTKSWGDYQKKDKVKRAQLLLYKYFFSKQFNIPLENIEVEFFILKRKIPQDTEYPVKPIQQFKPSQGKTSVNESIKLMEDFIETVFNENGLKQQEYNPQPSDFSCKYCQFNNSPLCNKGKTS